MFSAQQEWYIEPCSSFFLFYSWGIFQFVFMAVKQKAQISLAQWGLLPSEGTTTQQLFEVVRKKKVKWNMNSEMCFLGEIWRQTSRLLGCKTVSQDDAGKLIGQRHFKGQKWAEATLSHWITQKNRKLQDWTQPSNPEGKGVGCCKWNIQWTVQVAHDPCSPVEWKVFHFSGVDLGYCLACPAVGNSFCCLMPECCGKLTQQETAVAVKPFWGFYTAFSESFPSLVMKLHYGHSI